MHWGFSHGYLCEGRGVSKWQREPQKKIKELSARVHLHSKTREEKKRSTEAKCCEGEKTKKKGKDCPHTVQQLEKPIYYK